MIEQVESIVNNYVSKLEPIAKKAWEVSLLTYQIDAIKVLTWCLLSFVFLGVFAWFSMREYKKYEMNKSNEFRLIAILGVFIFSLVCSLISVIEITNVWLWVKMFNPELWAAKIILKRIGV